MAKNNADRSSVEKGDGPSSPSATELIESMTLVSRPWWDRLHQIGRHELQVLRKRALLSQCNEDYARIASRQTGLELRARKVKLLMIGLVGLIMVLCVKVISGLDLLAQIRFANIQIAIIVWFVQGFIVGFILRKAVALISCPTNKKEHLMTMTDTVAALWPVVTVIWGAKANSSHWIDITVLGWVQENLSEGVQLTILWSTTAIAAYFMGMLLYLMWLSNQMSWEESLEKIEKNSENPMTEMYAKRVALEEKAILNAVSESQNKSGERSVKRL